jgi:transcriptional regulator with XRE-family HTH domain
VLCVKVAEVCKLAYYWAMPALAAFLGSEIERREWPMDEFAKRADISLSLAYQIVRDGKDNVRRDTLASIALSFGMTASELLRIAETPSEDPVEQAVWRSVPELRQAVSGVPYSLLPTVIQDVLDRAIEGARDISRILTANASAGESVSNPDAHGLSRPARPSNKRTRGSNGPLADRELAAMGAWALIGSH